MIFYNWNSIYNKSEGSCNKIINIIDYLASSKPIPKSKKSKYYFPSLYDWKGQSFLINPKLLLEHRALYKDRHIAAYIGWASLRSYGDYEMSGITTLSLLPFRSKEEKIRANPLLFVKDNKIYFTFEEETN